MQGAGSDLHLLGRAVLDQLPAVDAGDERGGEVQHAVEAQHVGDQVVGEHRQPVEVGGARDAGAGEIGGGDLGALEERISSSP